MEELNKKSVDLNCDIGEGAPFDLDLLDIATSANIACGVHAGNSETMRRTVAWAADKAVAIGAHPGWGADFGRSPIHAPEEEIVHSVYDQVSRLADIAAQAGAKLNHVKPHGSLYNQAETDPILASAIVDAVLAFDSSLVIVGLAGGNLVQAATAAGMSVSNEIFADRAYCDDGTLMPRSLPGSIIHDPDIAAQRTASFVEGGWIESVSGLRLPLLIDTVCIHGDTPGALAMARKVRKTLEQAGIIVRPSSPQLPNAHLRRK